MTALSTHAQRAPFFSPDKKFLQSTALGYSGTAANKQLEIDSSHPESPQRPFGAPVSNGETSAVMSTGVYETATSKSPVPRPGYTEGVPISPPGGSVISAHVSSATRARQYTDGVPVPPRAASVSSGRTGPFYDQYGRPFYTDAPTTPGHSTKSGPVSPRVSGVISGRTSYDQDGRPYYTDVSTTATRTRQYTDGGPVSPRAGSVTRLKEEGRQQPYCS